MEDQKKIININITWQGIIKIIAVLAAVYFYFYQRRAGHSFCRLFNFQRDRTAVIWLAKRKIPRLLSAAVLYLLVISVVACSIFFVPPLAREVVDFSKNSPEYVPR